MEFIVKDRQFELPAEISNADELRKSLVPKLELYRNLVVTENGVAQAKTDRANLNRLKKAVDDERKKIKKRWLEPYQVLENECREIIALIDEPIKAIDSQIKALDEKALQEKRAVLEEHFVAENTLDFVALDDVLPAKWRNKSEKTDVLKKAMTEKIFQIKSDFDYLHSMYGASPLWTAIFREFALTNDKTPVLAYAVELERSERRLNGAVSVSETDNVITPETSQTAVADNSDGSQTITGAFRVTCTKKQLVSLRDFMVENGINFKVIREEKNYD